MIKLERGPRPECFSNPEFESARRAFLDEGKSQTMKRRRHIDYDVFSEVEASLVERFGSKCFLCESLLPDDSTSKVDRYRPWEGVRGVSNDKRAKELYHPDHYYWLAFEWENLFLACPTCRKYRRNYFPLVDESKRCEVGALGDELDNEGPLLLNPFVDTIEDHLVFDENGNVRPLTVRGEATIHYFGLEREWLKKGRREAAAKLKRELEGLARKKWATNEQFLSLLKELLVVNSKIPFAAVQRAVFKAFAAQHPRKVDLFETLGYFPDKEEAKVGGKLKTRAVAKSISQFDSEATSRFSIRRISIKNFRCIDTLTFDIPFPYSKKEAREPWLLVLGDNGIGKTSILQAIALALIGQAELKRLKVRAQDILRHGATEGEVRISSFESDEDVVLTFTKRSIRASLKDPVTYVLGYGSVRLLPKGSLKPGILKNAMVNVGNLFDYATSLTDPHKWVTKISRHEFTEKVAQALFDLLNLDDGDSLYLKRRKIWIRQSTEDHELESNSDGFRSVVALATDIMKTLATEGANYHAVQGIVLIDELGNHLHPRWRMKIVDSLRRTFPQLQFIVTTHEPLCLRGVVKGEVAVLVRDEEDRVRALDHELLPDHTKLRIDQLLTSDLFGLINVSDEETEKTYEKYYELLSKKETERTTEDKRKIEQYSKSISQSELMGATPQQQALFDMINEVSVQLREEGFKTRETLKHETISKVKSLIKEKKLDWL